jgi:streptogramin lyase
MNKASPIRLTIAVVLAMTAVMVAAASASALSPPTFSAAYGTKGSGNGQLKEPYNLAFDSSGNYWVVDAGNNRIEKFNAKGEYLSQFGSKGTGNGQFQTPTDIAIDSSGNLWVTDALNNRVQKFNSSGEYLSQFGSKGTGNGQFSVPLAIEADSSGNLWVVDFNHSRVEKFNPKGEYLSQFGSKGTGNGQLSFPEALTVDADGNVWVADTSNNRIEEFNTYGQYLSKVSVSAPLPHGIAIDPDGNIWVSTDENSVKGIYPEGEVATQFGKTGSGEGQFSGAFGIAVDATGNLWVADWGNGRVQKWTRAANGPVYTGAASQLTRNTAKLNATVNPQGVATSYQFQWGTTTSFGSVVPASPKSIGSGSTGAKVSESLTGLKAGTTYYYRVVASTAGGNVNGETRHFSTLPAAAVGAPWRIGSSTLAELGIASETFYPTGTVTMEIPSYGVTFSCSEELGGGASISGTNSFKETIRLKCQISSNPAECTFEPITIELSGNPASATPSPSSFKFTTKGKTCGTFENPAYTLPSSFAVEVGSEAVGLPVSMSGTGSWGINPLVIRGSSIWRLEGLNWNKPFGVW